MRGMFNHVSCCWINCLFSTRCSPPRLFQLEDCIGYIQQDELIEITPKGVRMRKAKLDPTKRKLKSKRKLMF